MIRGAHVIVYSKDADADRAFFRDVLKYESVDAGHGWLIFALPPAELAVHPSDENDGHEHCWRLWQNRSRSARIATSHGTNRRSRRRLPFL